MRYPILLKLAKGFIGTLVMGPYLLASAFWYQYYTDEYRNVLTATIHLFVPLLIGYYLTKAIVGWYTIALQELRTEALILVGCILDAEFARKVVLLTSICTKEYVQRISTDPAFLEQEIERGRLS